MSNEEEHDDSSSDSSGDSELLTEVQADESMPRWRCGRMAFENKKVTPDPRLGTLTLEFGEYDELLRVVWTPDDGSAGEDIIVVNDAYLERVNKPGLSGRTYVLKFLSSGESDARLPPIFLVQTVSGSSTLSTQTSRTRCE